MELNLPNDPEREFIVTIDTAHIRASRTMHVSGSQVPGVRCLSRAISLNIHSASDFN
jgi:hypothetical protein